MSGKYILIVHTCISTLILFPYPWRHQIDNGTVFHCIWTVLESNYLTNLLREILCYVLLLLFGRCYDFQDTLHARKDAFVSSFLNFSIWVLLQFNFVQYWKNKVSGNSFVLSVFWGLILSRIRFYYEQVPNSHLVSLYSFHKEILNSKGKESPTGVFFSCAEKVQNQGYLWIYLPMREWGEIFYLKH